MDNVSATDKTLTDLIEEVNKEIAEYYAPKTPVSASSSRLFAYDSVRARIVPSARTQYTYSKIHWAEKHLYGLYKEVKKPAKTPTGNQVTIEEMPKDA